jgi:hypothetical protein
MTSGTVPAHIEEAFLDFLIEQEDDDGPDAYWHADSWEIVSWSPQIQTLFIRNHDDSWYRDDWLHFEPVINSFLKERLGRKVQVGFFAPRGRV